MRWRKERQFVLAFYPTTHGLAFVLFEGPESPFDWGVKEIRDRAKNAQSINVVRHLLERYHPEAFVIEDCTAKGSKRSPRIRKLCRGLVHLAETEQIEVQQYSRQEIRQCFASVGAVTKPEIAEAIALQIPALRHRLPPRRRVWMSEDPRQSLFDAASLGITYYSSKAGPLAQE